MYLVPVRCFRPKVTRLYNVVENAQHHINADYFKAPAAQLFRPRDLGSAPGPVGPQSTAPEPPGCGGSEREAAAAVDAFVDKSHKMQPLPSARRAASPPHGQLTERPLVGKRLGQNLPKRADPHEEEQTGHAGVGHPGYDMTGAAVAARTRAPGFDRSRDASPCFYCLRRRDARDASLCWSQVEQRLGLRARMRSCAHAYVMTGPRIK